MHLVHRSLTTNVTFKRISHKRWADLWLCDAHTENIPYLLWRCDIAQQAFLVHVWVICEWKVCKSLNVTNMKLKGFVLSSNTKDFESYTIFDLIILFATFFIIYIMKNKHHFIYTYSKINTSFHVFKNQLTTRHEMEEYLSIVNMEYLVKMGLLYIFSSEQRLNIYYRMCDCPIFTSAT